MYLRVQVLCDCADRASACAALAYLRASHIA